MDAKFEGIVERVNPSGLAKFYDANGSCRTAIGMREFGGMAHGNSAEWHAKIQRGRARKLSGFYMRKFSGLTCESLVG
jgi:hypothetical protein